ncbi:MAG TPA: type IV pilin protein [Rhodocyclaceae bacterium]|nr:type IV pilin protein [Rhodocyclaceae bacterium]
MSVFCPLQPFGGTSRWLRLAPPTRPSAVASPARPPRIGGFTLIELMIVVVVIAILAAVALPSYQEHVRKSRRVDAQTAMLELAQFMERHYTTSNSYAGAALPGGVTDRVADFYTITLSAQSAQAYTLQAAPTSRQSADMCGTLTLSHTGVRTPTSDHCWN